MFFIHVPLLFNGGLRAIKASFVVNTSTIQASHVNHYTVFQEFVLILKSIELSFRSFAQGAQRWLPISAEKRAEAKVNSNQTVLNT